MEVLSIPHRKWILRLFLGMAVLLMTMPALAQKQFLNSSIRDRKSVSVLDHLHQFHPEMFEKSEDLKVAPGFEIELVFESEALNFPSGIDIDPLTGDLFVDNTGATNSIGTLGQILRINLATGQTSELVPLSNGFGMAFAPDGSLYFGVGNFLMGKWDPRTNVARKFAIIPGLRGIQADADGDLYAGEGSFGPKGLYKDAVLKVDTGDGFFEPVASASELTASLGISKDSLGSIAVDENGDAYMSFKEGTLFVKDGQTGQYAQIAKRSSFIGGLNQAPLRARDGVVYYYDIAGGMLFGRIDGSMHLIAFGDPLAGGVVDNAGLGTDGTTIYLCGDYNKIYRLRPTSGGTAKSTLLADYGSGAISGVITDSVTGGPLAGAQVSLNTGMATTTDENGAYAFSSVPVALYEITVAKDGFLETNASIEVAADVALEYNVAVATGLPSSLAPGLRAEVWTRVPGTSDVRVGADGSVYTANIFSSNITKHIVNPETMAEVRNFQFARGDGLDGAWYLDVSPSGTVFCANGNDGVFRLDPLPDDGTIVLSKDPSDSTIVYNQFGQNMVISLTRDGDGYAYLGNGLLAVATGSGGDPNPCAPEGTKNTVVKVDEFGRQCATIFTRGLPCSGGDSLFDNPDHLSVDPLGRLLVGNRGGNIVRVNSDGCSDWHLPGDGGGVEAHFISSFSGVNVDPMGNIFIRGGRLAPETLAIRMVDEEGRFYQVASGLRQCWAGLSFMDATGSSLVYTDLDLLVRIWTESGASIADVVRAGVTPE